MLRNKMNERGLLTAVILALLATIVYDQINSTRTDIVSVKYLKTIS